MNTTITGKITAALAGVAATAGVFTGIALAAPAQAKAAPAIAANCTSVASSNGANGSAPNPLTRAGQIAAIGRESNAGGPPVTCSRR